VTAALSSLGTTSSRPDPASPPRRLRLRPAPATDPPYDDELPHIIRPRPRLWSVPDVADQLPFPAPAPPPRPPEPPSFAPQFTSSAELPSPRRAAGSLVQAALEALCGRRPLQQLIGYTTDPVYRQLKSRVRLESTRRTRCRGPAEAPARLRSVHVHEPADGVAEVVAVVRQGDRHQALALRLEGVDGHWRCTTFEFV
jgi:hypothetical protein